MTHRRVRTHSLGTAALASLLAPGVIKCVVRVSGTGGKDVGPAAMPAPVGAGLQHHEDTQQEWLAITFRTSQLRGQGESREGTELDRGGSLRGGSGVCCEFCTTTLATENVMGLLASAPTQ